MSQSLKYQDGSEIKIGDFVRLENGTVGTIYQLVSTEDEIKAIRVEEPGILLDAIPDGLIYLPQSTFVEDPLKLVSRVA